MAAPERSNQEVVHFVNMFVNLADVATRWPRCFFLAIELRVRLEPNSLRRQMIAYSWILFSTPAPPPFISDMELGSSRVLMNESSFVPFLLLVLVGLFTAALFRCIRYFPIENALVSLTQKDLERVQGPPAESLGEPGKPSSRNLGQISTANANLQKKFRFRASQVFGAAAV